MPGSLMGTEVRRVEDPKLIRGEGSYVDNLALGADLLHLVFVRSPLPHATITHIDTSAALAAPGVVAVYTAEDLAIPAHHSFMAVNEACARPPLATGKVRFVGDIVAAVIAESRAAAIDAVELVEVDYDPLPVAIDPEDALADGAPAQFEELGSNLAAGVRSAPDEDPLADAEVVVRARMENQRLAVVPMEGNAIAVIPGGPGDEHELTVYVSTQMPHAWRGLTGALFGIEPERIRVVTPDVGGGFGGKAGIVSEHSISVAAARKLNRAVKWAETRSENLVGMPHGRAMVQYAELGLRRSGEITGLRIRVIGDAGAYAGFGGALAMGPSYSMAQGVYRIPKIGYDVAVALTNTTPVGAFRGAGRPEATALLERMIDLAAVELDVDPADLRRRNFIGPAEFPYETVVGTTYDCGDYSTTLDEALRVSDYEKLRAEQATRRESGSRTVLGIGLASYVEITAGGGAEEWGSVTVHADGTATASVGTSGHGQGHPTSFAMLVSDQLGIPMESIKFVQSDTAVVPRGGGTGGSRSLQLGGTAIYTAAGKVLDQARELAAELLEASAEDIEVTEAGGLGVAGVPGRGVSWAQLASVAESRGETLSAALDVDQGGATFPFGSHVAVVEVDLDTGHVTPVRHFAVDDCGRVLNPLIVRGQQHGGIAQGVAQALWEHVRFDEEGNPTTGTLADYTVPTAADLPPYEVRSTETPTPLNVLGAKGIGEAATIGATPAVQNAVVDALSHLGVRHVDMPCTPERVWRAIEATRNGGAPDPWREPPAIFTTLPVRGETEELETADI
ncbi:xanthine dehydrogenase family protein molybdopterin-binding subunit [Pseudonocardia spinosispora]|uniref:xanthine dehydrogenase family protein molybdopterin-binding subunit n=1 Tax=Pseudonocardia spinosispora TaxID=103441 RepID=UPI00048C97DB|nr:xanthine dehydrogenase family protein molybdopterin-binding subunit [Pseudonocardia spinosispora]